MKIVCINPGPKAAFTAAIASDATPAEIVCSKIEKLLVSHKRYTLSWRKIYEALYSLLAPASWIEMWEAGKAKAKKWLWEAPEKQVKSQLLKFLKKNLGMLTESSVFKTLGEWAMRIGVSAGSAFLGVEAMILGMLAAIIEGGAQYAKWFVYRLFAHFAESGSKKEAKYQQLADDAWPNQETVYKMVKAGIVTTSTILIVHAICLLVGTLVPASGLALFTFITMAIVGCVLESAIDILTTKVFAIRPGKAKAKKD